MVRLLSLVLLLTFGNPAGAAGGSQDQDLERLTVWMSGSFSSREQSIQDPVGRFAPSSDAEKPNEERRLAILCQWGISGERLIGTAAGWSDAALDRCRPPRPALGKLTVREMLYFTRYHNAQHLRRVEERRREAGTTEEPSNDW